MALSVVVYEDSGWVRLLPLVYVQAVFQLVCGMGDLLSKVIRLVGVTGEECGVWCRSGLSGVVAEETGTKVNSCLNGEGTLLLNGRGIWKKLPEVNPGEISWVGTEGRDGHIACVYLNGELAEKLSSDDLLDDSRVEVAFEGIPRRDVGQCVRLINWPWELVLANDSSLVDDWKWLASQAGLFGQISERSSILGPESVHIGSGTVIKPFVVIDAERGPVWIGRNVTVFPHSYIQGPAFIGDGSLLHPGSVVHSGTHIGPESKVGGEIDNTVFQGYSNKQHNGFLGHSYVCSWVNIGADCTNSDLKNTYGTVRVPINGHEIESEEVFVGMFMGDHCKSGINVGFPTGAVVGFCSNVITSPCPKFVPCFSWLEGDKIRRFDEDRALDIARRMMARREVEMSEAQKEAFLAVSRLSREIESQEVYGIG